jgi:hypothetical protein
VPVVIFAASRSGTRATSSTPVVRFAASSVPVSVRYAAAVASPTTLVTCPNVSISTLLTNAGPVPLAGCAWWAIVPLLVIVPPVRPDPAVTDVTVPAGGDPVDAEVIRPCASTVMSAVVYEPGVTAVSASLSAVTASSFTQSFHA